jgi:hypothetical protein
VTRYSTNFTMNEENTQHPGTVENGRVIDNSETFIP